MDLKNEKTRTPKPISNDYNEKILKRMGYVLKDNKWTPKSIKKWARKVLQRKKLHRGVVLD